MMASPQDEQINEESAPQDDPPGLTDDLTERAQGTDNAFAIAEAPYTDSEDRKRCKFAILFRVRYWNKDVDRIFSALQYKIDDGELWVVSDDTNGAVDVPAGVNEFRIRSSMVDEIGLPKFPEDSVFWYNDDYVLYLFYREHPEFQYYLLVEADTIPTFRIDNLVRAAGHLGLDLVAMPHRNSGKSWNWLSTCTELWPEALVCPHFLCFVLIAGRAIPSLLAARHAHADRFAKGEIQEWPLAEGFVATHLSISGFHLADLSQFVDTRDYDWWPPTHYDQVGKM